jgi:hypothetical protein
MATDPYDNILKPEKVLTLVRAFIDEHRIIDSEVIEQSDRVVEHSPDFINALCEAAGWAAVEHEEEEEDIVLGDYDEDNPDYSGGYE